MNRRNRGHINKEATHTRGRHTQEGDTHKRRTYGKNRTRIYREERSKRRDIYKWEAMPGTTEYTTQLERYEKADVRYTNQSMKRRRRARTLKKTELPEEGEQIHRRGGTHITGGGRYA